MKEPRILHDLKPGDRAEAVVKLVVTDSGHRQKKRHEIGRVMVRPSIWVETAHTGQAQGRPGTPAPITSITGEWVDGEPFFVDGNTEVIRLLKYQGEVVAR